MKKNIVLACFLTVLLLVCAACGATPTSTGAADRGEQFAQAYGKIESSLPEMMEIPDDALLDFYGIEPSEFESGFFRLSVDNMLADEVIFVQAKDDASAAHIEEMLNARLQAKAEEAESYSPEQYDIISKCSVYREGLTLALIVNADAGNMLKTFQQAIA